MQPLSVVANNKTSKQNGDLYTVRLSKELYDVICSDPTQLVFLCGAGISLDSPTSLPTVNNFIRSLLVECGVSDDTIEKVHKRMGMRNYRFESLIEEIAKTCDRTFEITKLLHSKTFNEIHCFLSKMLRMGSSVITTNFDNCIENAEAYIFKNSTINRFVYTGKDLTTPIKETAGIYIKIHGSHPIHSEPATELVITISALAKTERAFAAFPIWKQSLLNTISGKTIVVMGYSGSDDFDVIPLLEESSPKEVIWLDFDSKNLLPSLVNKSNNINIERLKNFLPISIFRGQLLPLLTLWSNHHGFINISGPSIPPFSVKEYITYFQPTLVQKILLSNEILLSYGLYEDINHQVYSPEIQFQQVKSLFRLGKYKETEVLCKDILCNTVSNKLHYGILYYLSSALYFQADYLEALNHAHRGMLLGYKSGDIVYYMNALINYASISFVYASTLDEKQEKKLISNAERKYRYVLQHSSGISVEAHANALWGLGEIEHYRNNYNEALAYLEKALEILLKIGNSYAINQLEKTIADIKLYL